MGLKEFASGLPVIGGLFDDSADQAMQQLELNKKLYGGLNTPTFQNYNPIAYNPDEAKATQIQEDPNTRSAQQNVLDRMAGLAQTGLSDVDNAGYERARQLGNQLSHSNTAAAMQNAQARGVGGSGLEFAMREAGSQQGAERAQEAALSQAAQSAQQRALYNQAYGQGLANLRGQDYNTNAANTGILNQFNMANTQNRNQAQQYNVGQQNYAQQYANDMKQRQYDDQYKKVQGQAGANTAEAGGYAAQNAANTSNRNANTGLAFDAIGGAFSSTPKPKYDTDTGASLYDPQSGKKYGDNP